MRETVVVWIKESVQNDINALQAIGYEIWGTGQADHIIMVRNSNAQEQINALQDENKELRNLIKKLRKQSSSPSTREEVINLVHDI